MKSHRNAGQFKLRGKQSRLLSCRCCEVVDLRRKHEKREARATIDASRAAEKGGAK